tara:strand:- start:114 stop:638 length:525 start_codon:yes stop_codon:yes gene_type:complete
MQHRTVQKVQALPQSDIETSFDVRRHITRDKRKKIRKQDLDHVEAFHALVHLAKYQHITKYNTPQIVDLFAIFAKNMQTIETVDQHMAQNATNIYWKDYYKHIYEEKCIEVTHLEGRLAKSTSKEDMLDLLENAHDEALHGSTSGEKEVKKPTWLASDAHIGAMKQTVRRIRAL